MTVEQYKTLNRRHLAEGLKGLRMSFGYSLEDLSFMVNKDIGYLSRIENMKLFPKIETLSEILAVYEMTVKEFYDRLDDLI